MQAGKLTNFRKFYLYKEDPWVIELDMSPEEKYDFYTKTTF